MAADQERQRKPYHSPRRAEQAVATRQAVLDAARELFIEQGMRSRRSRTSPAAPGSP